MGVPGLFRIAVVPGAHREPGKQRRVRFPGVPVPSGALHRPRLEIRSQFQWFESKLVCVHAFGLRLSDISGSTSDSGVVFLTMYPMLGTKILGDTVSASGHQLAGGQLDFVSSPTCLDQVHFCNSDNETNIQRAMDVNSKHLNLLHGSDPLGKELYK